MTHRILILCTGNSARSQMAEGLLYALAGKDVEVMSAGTKPSAVHPLAIQVMSEKGSDISRHRPKHLSEFLTQSFDYVITVCDQAAETCPVFPGRAQRIHWSFSDPAAAKGTEAERLSTFREIRDSIEQQLQSWLATHPFHPDN